MYQGICIANCESKVVTSPKRSVQKTLERSGLNPQADPSTMSGWKQTEAFLYIETDLQCEEF